ncbi:uncharacterized protein Pyn_02299 [Prunus yedoensis var. nudiflora]|uniref:DUF3741 domain-containing protein n=1 Tax=Prunus yedoensis var. nudiflora TaxID=2094558 RepID=A0A314XXV1_PRUYE|nr:uncharacterized protein Pyn_02299 [Prunus yedoensis var. nudiflora]
MKLPSSSPSFSSCSSSSSTSTAFDAAMCNPKGAAAGCLAGIFRRILCYGSFPTYPSDHITEEEEQAANSVESYKDQDFKSMEKTGEKTEEKTESAAAPSLVARLMGLESIPDVNLVNGQSTLNSISRSKSMNSVDRFAGGGDDTMQAQHRKVKSTQSFREMPTFLELENEEFFILSFENESKGKEMRSKGRKGEMGCREGKQKRAGKSKNNENITEREADKKKKQVQEGKSRRVLKDLNGREILRSRSRSSSDNPSYKVGNINGIVKDSKSASIPTICDVLKNVESECSSEDLSPVSVLDCGQFLVDPEAPTSDQEDSGLPCPCKDNGLIGDARRTKAREGKCLGSRKKEFHSGKHIEMWGEICRLAEDELVGSNWIIQNKGSWNQAGSAGIGADFESQILGQLLDELVDQFVDSPLKIQNL